MSYLNPSSSDWLLRTSTPVCRTSFYVPQFNWTLKWRQQQLLVRALQPLMESTSDHPAADWLRDRLAPSPVRRVKLDPTLGTADLVAWAEACDRSGKPVFLSLPSSATLPQRSCRLGWVLKRSLDWAVALVLAVLMTPLVLVAIIRLWPHMEGPIWMQDWYVGERGRLFKRWMVCPGVLAVHPWLERWGVAMLPGLVNVLRGQMSLVGACPLTLAEVAECAPVAWRRLNALPGILNCVGQARVPEVLGRGASELEGWSLRQDLRSLILLLPRLLLDH